ncbi:acetylserotonin O-methyltransferase [Flavobacterium sp. F-65]|uniref:Acetylserotonin O-methyltransferase n=1 Tax=Flavobacterium pisciphilum TaxID=2893755 RepID=A0ABS8MR70_9FLAO|nr:acetylserotonin O-methyltransferase [Flavobacterium sp. F-65]MCC9070637.1 acetylserotonin O-methyltransferase [Flavobacterium sp. F-65]
MKNLPKNPELTFKMYELISGYWVACAIHSVAKLEIADLLVDEPKSLSELAKESQSDETSLYRLLRATASVGIFEELPNGKFKINDLGATLLTDVPGSIKPWALANLGEHYPAFGNLTYGVQTGKVSFDDVYEKSVWEYYKDNPDAGANLMKAMAGVSGAVLKGIIDTYDFSPYKTIVDIGGGNGAMLFTVLYSSPSSKGIIFDEPYVVEATAKQIPDDLKNRVSVSGGSFFDEIPANADLYLTKWVIHDWNDKEAIDILKVCYKAMPVGGKLLIIDSVISDELNGPHAGKLLDLNLMALTTGKERTLSEFKSLLKQVGLSFIRLIETNTEISGIIECEKLV